MATNLFTPSELQAINYCRLYLQATTIADITQANGRRFDRGVLFGSANAMTSTSNWLHTNQRCPDHTSWIVWRRAMSIWASPNGDLYCPLGPWLHPANHLRRTWKTYFDPYLKVAYLRVGDAYKQYSPSNTKSIYLPTETQLCDIHHCWIPMTSFLLPDGSLEVPPQDIQVTRPAHPPIAETFTEYIRLLPPWERQLLEHITLFVSPFTIIHQLTLMHEVNPYIKTSLLVGSDGSVEDVQLTFGWTMATPAGQRLAQCEGPACGSTPSSFRSEAYGLLSATRFLFNLIKFSATSSPWKVNFVSDNLGLVKRINARFDYPHPYPNATLEPDWDAVEQIFQTFNSLPIIPSIAWIASHQDDEICYDDLPLQSQLNVDADHLAGHHQLVYGKYLPKVVRLPVNSAQLHLSEHTINTAYRKHIREAYTLPSLTQYTTTKFYWHPSTFSLVDWRAFHSGSSKFHKQRVTLVKFCQLILPVNQYLHRRNQKPHPLCTLCGIEVEDQDHLYFCSCPQLVALRHPFLTKLRKTFAIAHATSSLADLLCNSLQEWLSNHHVHPKPHQKYQRISYQQTKVGWSHLLRGRFCTEWSLAHDQQSRFQTEKERVRGSLLISRLIVVCFQFFLDLWDTRNSIVHGHTFNEQQIRRKQKLLRIITSLHREQHLCLSRDRSLFLTETIDELPTICENKTPAFLDNWIRTWKPAIKKSIQSAKKMAAQHVKTLDKYFSSLSLQSKRAPKPRQSTRDHTKHDKPHNRRRRNDVRTVKQYHLPIYHHFPRMPPKLLLLPFNHFSST